MWCAMCCPAPANTSGKEIHFASEKERAESKTRPWCTNGPKARRLSRRASLRLRGCALVPPRLRCGVHNIKQCEESRRFGQSCPLTSPPSRKVSRRLELDRILTLPVVVIHMEELFRPAGPDLTKRKQTTQRKRRGACRKIPTNRRGANMASLYWKRGLAVARAPASHCISCSSRCQISISISVVKADLAERRDLFACVSYSSLQQHQHQQTF